MAIAVSLILGVALGVFLGFVLSSSVQSWLGHREWKEASRELELADRLFETLVDAGGSHPASKEDGPLADEPVDAPSLGGPVMGPPPLGPG